MPNFLQSLFAGMLGGTEPMDPATRKALEQAVQVVDPQLRALPGLEQKLGPPVAEALSYSALLANQLPGPLPVSHKCFASEPLVHALFSTAADIDRMLGTSQAIRDYLHETESYEVEYFHALFAARRVEKRQLGVASCGDVIRTDVPQTVLYFSDHTLSEPSADLINLRKRLQQVFLDSLLKSFSAHLQGLRQERESVRAGLSMERAHLTVLRGKTGGSEIEVHTRRFAELDARLREVGSVLSPSALLVSLTNYLRQPQESLRLEPFQVTVDRLGIVVEGAQSGPVGLESGGGSNQNYGFETLRFPEMIARDRRRYMVMLAKIDVAEARAAVDRVTEAQRRFLII